MGDTLLSDTVSAALQGHPADLAMEFHGQSVPWGYVETVAAAVDAALTAAGIGPCTPVGMAPRNRPSFCAALLALLAGRRSIVMVYAFQSQTAMAADLARQTLPAVIVDAQDLGEPILSALDPATVVLVLDGDLQAGEPVRVLRDGAGRDRAHLRGPTSEPILEMLTSGTTGAPKRHPVTYSILEKGVVSGSVLDQGKGSGAPFPPGTVNFPISNISGIYSYLAMAAARRPVMLMEKFNLDEWRAFVRRHRPVAVVLPPAGVRMMLDAHVPPAEMAGVRYVMAGTSAIDRDTHAEFERTYGVSILLSYGATEFCGAATTMTAELHGEFGAAKFGSVGKPCPGNDVRIVDPETRQPVLADETGLLEVRIGAIGPDYIKTTDLGMIDQDGFLFIKGRADGVISRGGFKILPSSVEAVLNRYPGVSNAVVVGLPDPRLGQVPVAAVEMEPGRAAPTPAELEAHARAALPSTHIPVRFVVVEALPRTASLKVDLRASRALFEPQPA
jgi:acyl-CoA synthetase (AMP-forming)/AMP-acid ligase II